MSWARRHGRYGNPDANQQEIVDHATGVLPELSVENTTGVGGGFVDLVLGFRALTVLVEIKKPITAKKPRKIKSATDQLRGSQQDFRRTWRGGVVLDIDNGPDLVQQLIGLDRRTPPVRGASDRYQAGTAQAILADCMAAAKGLVVDPDDLPALIRKLRGTT